MYLCIFSLLGQCAAFAAIHLWWRRMFASNFQHSMPTGMQHILWGPCIDRACTLSSKPPAGIGTWHMDRICLMMASPCLWCSSIAVRSFLPFALRGCKFASLHRKRRTSWHSFSRLSVAPRSFTTRWCTSVLSRLSMRQLLVSTDASSRFKPSSLSK